MTVDGEGRALMREYRALLWIGDEPGIRLELLAPSLAAAKALIVETYGEGHVISLWNDEDSRTPRGVPIGLRATREQLPASEEPEQGHVA
ncbi:hypothetical protein [Dactylosporangium sp. CS-033363]|uniref:hypothetical protein n=1 Tax=Dactylosporangium sp. CS-033363 TaxID=3239935 RepID=UPI003D93D87B